jgi:acetyl esterase/lipase
MLIILIHMDSSVARRRILGSILLLSPGIIFSGLVAVRRAGIAVLYKPAALPESQVLRDVSYRNGSDDEKHRLDLFLPQGTDWPVLVFIHGGGLNSGDKALRVGGADVYGNIGRFYASQGIGVVLINYRLQPQASWREQVQDVAHAMAWTWSHLGTYGANIRRMFVGGHSAGAYLAARVALDPAPLAGLGLSPRILSGVIAVSGAGFDLNDSKTYELGHRLCDYEARFRCGDPTENWKGEASPITYLAPGAPPFLILYAEGESKSLQRQSQRLHEALSRHGVRSDLVVVPGENHCRIVLTLSRSDKTSAPAILRFVKDGGAL